MPRVKCPHCGAGNQDATEASECWQCGNVLGQPPTRTTGSLDMHISPANNVPSAPTQQLDASVLQQISASTPAPRHTAVSQTGATPRTTPIVLILAALLVVAVVVLLIVLFRR